MGESYHYEQIKKLGGGGFGTVWLVRDTGAGKLVALKIMNIPQEEQHDLKALERFMREIEIARLLDHPHVLPALDSGSLLLDGHRLPYLVSPYMPDGSLATLIRQMPPWQHWTLAQIADVILQAAQGLDYLHTRNPCIVHQDIKPDNFLLHYEKRPERIAHLYLSDFGISRWQRTPFDHTSNVLGTLSYMAPEQLSGIISPTADQYALGVMAYYLLTGVLPKRNRPLLPSHCSPKHELSDQADNVLLQVLQQDPEQRYPSVLAFATALQEALGDQSFANSSEQTQRESPIALVTGTNNQPAKVQEEFSAVDIQFFTGNRFSPQKPPATPPTSTLPSRPELTRSPSSQFSFKEHLRQELSAPPRMLRWSGDGNALVCTFHTEAPVLLERDGGQKTIRITEPVRMACWSPDNRVLALISQRSLRGKTQSKVYLWRRDAPTEEPLLLLSRDHAIESLDWSTRGQLTLWIEDRIEIYTLPAHPPQPAIALVPQTLSEPELYCGNADALCWSPDGSMLAAGTRDGVLLCWKANTQRAILRKREANQLIFGVAWSRDNRLLAAAFSGRQLGVWQIGNGEKVTAWKDLGHAPRSLSISTEQDLAIASDGSKLLLGQLAEVAPTASHPGYWLACWSPTRPELATLDAQNDKVLVIWEK